MSGEASDAALVLVADDDDDVRELLAFRLQRAGYEVVVAAHGEEAVAIALERRPRMCIVDVMMPRLDGYEVTRRLRAEPRMEGVAIMLLTASAEDRAVERGFEAGADDYVVKPFAAAELLERVATALDRDQPR